MTSFRLYNRRLDAFLACARTGSFTKAAQLLYVSPTALIKQINQFEDGLGVTLFNRSARGLTLTKAGERLAHEADALVALSETIVRDVSRTGADKGDEINVGTSSVFSGRYVFDCWYRSQAKMPQSKLRLISFENKRAEVDRVLEHLGEEIDLIAGVFDDRFLERYGCSGVVLEQVPIGCSVHASDKLAHKPVLEIEELSQREILLPRTGMLEDFDRAGEFLRQRLPHATFTEFDLLDIEVFNRAADNHAVILNIGCWSDAHPLFKLVPIAWNECARFGFILPKNPSETVSSFVQAVRQAAAP